MSGFQFIHIETFAKVASRSKKKQSARNIAREAERDLGACPHIENPMPFKLMYGMTPSQAVDLAEERALIGKDSRGRRLRRDAQILLGGVASYPVPICQLTPDDEGLKKWLKHNFDFLTLHCGDTLKSISAHTDEKYFHLHWYQVPDIDESGRMNIGQVHPGVLARDLVGGKRAKEKMRAYKSAMREFQDSYYEHVGKPCGLTREGAKKRRLTRVEWKVEQAAAERLAQSLNTISFANDQLEALEDKNKLIIKNKEKLLFEQNTLLGLKNDLSKELQFVNAKIDDLLSLESRKISTVKYLKDKAKKLTEKAKSLLKKVSWLERENADLKEDVSSLTKQNSKLIRSNENLAYQNEVKSAGLKRQRNEIYSIINLIDVGKQEEVSQHYNKHKEYVL